MIPGALCTLLLHLFSQSMEASGTCSVLPQCMHCPCLHKRTLLNTMKITPPKRKTDNLLTSRHIQPSSPAHQKAASGLFFSPAQAQPSFSYVPASWDFWSERRCADGV